MRLRLFRSRIPSMNLKNTLLIGLILSLSASAQNSPSRAGWPTELRFGVIPLEVSKETKARFAPLVKHLEKTLKMPVKLSIGADYAAVITAMQFGKLELAYFGPGAYVLAADRGIAQAFAMENTLESGTGDFSYIVTKASSKIRTLQDATKASFAFVDPNSTSGYLLPMRHFYVDLKLEPQKFFSQVVFSGSHEASIEGLVEGTFDVAVTSGHEVGVAIRDKEIRGWQDLRVLWKSAAIPTAPLAYRQDLPQSFKTALRDAIVNFKDPSALKVMQLKGFASAQDIDYSGVRELTQFQKTLKK